MLFRRRKPHIVHHQVDEYPVEVSFKPIRNMYLKVSRRTGEIRVSAPMDASLKVIRDFVLSRRNWIEKHLSKPIKSLPELTYKEGEVHRYFGLEVPLKLDYVNKNINAYLHNDAIVLRIKTDYDTEKRGMVLDHLYRKELKKMAGELIKKWEPVMRVKVDELRIRKMKTRWGTCNIRDRRIWLNLHLAMEKPEVIEMVVVHEMVHLLERLHNKRFYQFMDHFLPDWKERSKELDGRVC